MESEDRRRSQNGLNSFVGSDGKIGNRPDGPDEMGMQVRDLNQQGKVLLKAGHVQAAREKFEKAISKDPMAADNYKNMGSLHMLTEEYQEAKNCYKKALLIEKSGETYFRCGNACFMNDEPQEGLDYYNRALSAGYDSDEMLFLMGLAYEHLNDDRMALRYVQKALGKNPSSPDYKVKKIGILLRTGMTDDAAKEIEDLILNDPELYDGYHMKTSLLIQEKKFEEAAEFSKKAAEKFPEDADLLYDYVLSVTMCGRYEEATDLVRQAERLKYFDENARQRFSLLEAEILAETGDIDRAIEKCLECIDLERKMQTPFNGQLRFMLINLYLTKPDFGEALLWSEELADQGDAGNRDSFYFAALYFRPYCLKNLDREEEAEKRYREAVSLYRLASLENPEVPETYLYRAMCLKDLKQYDEALEMLDFLEQLSDGGIAEIYTIRADICKLTGKDVLAEQELEKAYKLKPQLRDLMYEVEEHGDRI